MGKKEKYLWGKRTGMRRFVDLLNDLRLFEENISYPVMHPRKVVSYEDKKNVWYITKEDFNQLYQNFEILEKEKIRQMYEENFLKEKANFPKICPAYVDYEKRTYTFNKELSILLKHGKIEEKVEDFSKYIFSKIENTTDCSVNISKEGKNLNMKISLMDKKEDGFVIRYGTYFVDIYFLKMVKNSRKDNTCDVVFDLRSCTISVYV